ncbi:uncharacterized protein LOC128548803 [Mercenaria mercenaria]|uniref:uncharacterized protein LOC128548803 n=1 Tax=Mercenaria mercenaria TaxID=6596 RepID=UPI00234F01D3|nr:uncharacterized protein LOC128548803 [Mercenaria mercenaria]
MESAYKKVKAKALVVQNARNTQKHILADTIEKEELCPYMTEIWKSQDAVVKALQRVEAKSKKQESSSSSESDGECGVTADEMEEAVRVVKRKRDIYDFDDRVGLKSDYIAYDRMNSILDSDDYVPDLPLDRTSMDTQFNPYDFNIFSDHAILEFKVVINCKSTENDKGNSFQYTKWFANKRDEFRRRLITRLPELNLLLSDSEAVATDRNTVDSTGNRSVGIINEEAKPLFYKEVRSNNVKVQFDNNDILKRSERFDETCRVKKNEYLEALRLFNDVKTDENRYQLMIKKKQYKACIKDKRRKHKIVRMREIEALKSKKTRDFWKFFSKKNNKRGDNISLNDFYEYFNNLSDEINVTTDGESEDFCRNGISVDDPVFAELDSVITMEEVRQAIKSLKRGKAGGNDGMINEYFIETGDIIGSHLRDLFNIVLSSGHFPSAWMEGLIIPVFKKGDDSNVQNYRGITLVSSISKMFTSILNKRMSDWSRENNIISDSQFGFKKGLSTTDAIFCLHSVISHMLNNGKRFYSTFIDMRKCFDSVYRNALWFKMSKLGVGGKMLTIIRSMYEHVKCRIRHGKEFSDFIEIAVGLKQGEICSPLLWSMFIEDLELYLGTRPGSGLNFDDLTLILFLYADDMVLFSDTVQGLQQSLEDLHVYCDRWGLSVNIDKTKVMVFRKRGPVRENEKWTYNGSQLEVVNNFNYLGVVFDSHGKFSFNIQMLVGNKLDAGVRYIGEAK